MSVMYTQVNVYTLYGHIHRKIMMIVRNAETYLKERIVPLFFYSESSDYCSLHNLLQHS